MLLVVVLYAILALTFVFAKEALAYAQPVFLIGVRMLLAGLLLLGYQYVFNRTRFLLNKEDAWLFAKTALFHIYFAFVLEFWALQYLTSSKTNLMYSATPFIAALLSYVLLGERLSIKKIGAVCIGLVGLVPVLVLQASPGELGGELWRFSLPEVVLLGAIVSSAYAWFLVKKLMGRGYSLVMINGVAMLYGGILALSTSLIVEVALPLQRGQFAPLVSNLPSFLFWIFLLIIAANVVVYNLYGWLLHTYSITFLTFAGFLCPIFGAFFGWLFLDEVITWHYVASLGMVTGALYLFYQEERAR